MNYDEIRARLESNDYVNADAERKRELLWEQIEGSRYATLPAIRYSILRNTIRILDLRLLRRAFETTEDVRPPRVKVFHPWGTVAKVRWRSAGDHPYTGMFEGVEETAFLAACALSVLLAGDGKTHRKRSTR
jgi:hypothetical protein